MKIIAVIDNRIDAGGGFVQAGNALQQFIRLVEGEHDYAIVTTVSENIAVLKKTGLDTVFIPMSFWDRIRIILKREGIGGMAHKLLDKLPGFEGRLLAEDCDLVYLSTPSRIPYVLNKMNYVYTVWDICHLDFPEFPEVRSHNEFELRERMYNAIAKKAVAVLLDSQELVERFAHHYRINRDRLIAMPFSPPPGHIDDQAVDGPEVLEKYNIAPGYLFYPAQFWAHKNHIRILEALSILKERNGFSRKAVFCGGDKGFKGHIEAKIAQLDLEKEVKIIGFVDSDDMSMLYRQSHCLIMPTYFGPTNVPPLEAWSLGVPVIYSKHLQGQAGNAAILVDPDTAESVADGILAVDNESVRQDLRENGFSRLQELQKQRDASEAKLSQVFNSYAARSRTWASAK